MFSSLRDHQSSPLTSSCTAQVHPTVNPGSGDILELIRDKKVLAKPGIERVDGLTVHFTDGSSENVDAIICATGALLSQYREPVIGSCTSSEDVNVVELSRYMITLPVLRECW